MFVAPPPHLVCSVCHEAFDDPVTLNCGHAYCRACAVLWFQRGPSARCPEARCDTSAKSKPAKAATAWRLKAGVDALHVYCRFGLREDERGGWAPDPTLCHAQLAAFDVAAHEAVCEYALEPCPFAGCGVERRRRDADAHNAEAALAHASGEQVLRLVLEAQLRSERETRRICDAVWLRERATLEGRALLLQALLDELEAKQQGGGPRPSLQAARPRAAAPAVDTSASGAPRDTPPSAPRSAAVPFVPFVYGKFV